MKTVSLFPVQIRFGALKGISASHLKALKADCLGLGETDEDGIEWSARHYPNGFTSYGSLDQLQNFSSDFTHLTRALTLEARAFAKALGWKAKPFMSDCWVNVMMKDGFHSGHIHPGSLLSGTFYVSVPRGSGGLRLEDPNAAARMMEPVTPEQKWFFQPRAGEFILFPSWLRHEVLPCKASKEPRISVSFNFFAE